VLLPSDPELLESIRQAVYMASTRAEAIDAVATVYAQLQGEVDQRRPACAVSGRCCRFEEYGHRLFVTTIELGAFVRGLAELPAAQREKLNGASADWDRTGCPFQMARLCGVHAIRPFGCRIYFCDPTAQAWQQEVYERLHGKLKGEHERLGIPYFYIEWREALKLLLGEGMSVGSAPGKGIGNGDPQSGG